MLIRASIAIRTGKTHLILGQSYIQLLPSPNNNHGRQVGARDLRPLWSPSVSLNSSHPWHLTRPPVAAALACFFKEQEAGGS